jgi:hypothetical protein
VCRASDCQSAYSVDRSRSLRFTELALVHKPHQTGLIYDSERWDASELEDLKICPNHVGTIKTGCVEKVHHSRIAVI